MDEVDPEARVGEVAQHPRLLADVARQHTPDAEQGEPADDADGEQPVETQRADFGQGARRAGVAGEVGVVVEEKEEEVVVKK